MSKGILHMHVHVRVAGVRTEGLDEEFGVEEKLVDGVGHPRADDGRLQSTRHKVLAPSAKTQRGAAVTDRLDETDVDAVAAWQFPDDVHDVVWNVGVSQNGDRRDAPSIHQVMHKIPSVLPRTDDLTQGEVHHRQVVPITGRGGAMLYRVTEEAEEFVTTPHRGNVLLVDVPTVEGEQQSMTVLLQGVAVGLHDIDDLDVWTAEPRHDIPADAAPDFRFRSSV